MMQTERLYNGCIWRHKVTLFILILIPHKRIQGNSERESSLTNSSFITGIWYSYIYINERGFKSFVVYFDIC